MQLFENAIFISCEDENRLYSVLVEDHGKIVYLGDSIPEKYSHAIRLDLNGTYVVPAFADTHIHFESFSMFLSNLDVRAAADFDELADTIRRHIANHPSEKVILGFGVSQNTTKEKRLPAKTDLDAITGRPILIIKYDGHAAIANSSLLATLPSSVLKSRGFEESTGSFFQESYYNVVRYLTRSVPLMRVLRNMIQGSDYMAHKGIGLIHTVEGIGFPRDQDVDIMRAGALGLPQSFRTYFQTMNIRKVLRRKLPCVGGCFATALDGCYGSQDAALKEPYSNNPSNCGVLFYPQETVTEFVKKANRARLQVAMHAVGDAAVEQALNAYESALADFPRKNHRHVIIHADTISDAQIERAASLEVCIALQTPFLFWEQEPMDYLESLIGKRIRNFIPVKDLIDAGILLGNGSDGPCTFPDPIFGIHAACNHPIPEQRIGPLDALKMATNWPARISFDEKERGTLSIGKKADFVVLDQHLLDIPVEKIKDTQVLAVYLAGELYTGQKDNALHLLLQCARKKLLH